MMDSTETDRRREPEAETWEHAGLQCAAYQNAGGHFCGYVGVPASHPLYGTGYSTNAPVLAAAWRRREGEPVNTKRLGMGLMLGMLSGELAMSPEVVFDVFGGITYADEGDDWAGRTSGLWWFGFDTAHSGAEEEGATSMDYTKAETNRLAEQITQVAQDACGGV